MTDHLASASCIRLPSVDSTNQYCLERTDELPGGTIVVADRQTAGRGRQGRRWVSPPGCNLYTSILLKPPFLRVEPGLISQLASLAILDALLDTGVSGCWIKWPNDLLVEHRKIAGVLCESSRQRQQTAAVVVGMGINLNMQGDVLATIDRPATSVLALTGQCVDRDEFLDVLYRYFSANYQVAQQHGFAPLYPRWRQASRLIGRKVVLYRGSQTVTGTVEDLQADGALVLAADDGTRHTCYQGEVSLRLETELSGGA